MKSTFGISSCSGCGACVQTCPTHSIEMRMDREGFYYPIIETEKCINCRKCVSVCPANKEQSRDYKYPIKAYAAYNKNISSREISSSGGIFILLAEEVIRNNGVVFGARFNESWDVIHDYTETMDGVYPFCGSKYVQSQIGDAYKYVKHFLDQGRLVLFCGTPCQILGLRSYLRNKQYTNLLLVDFICHGVPSPGIWQWYLKVVKQNISIKSGIQKWFTIFGKEPSIEKIEFRNKEEGWKKYRFLLQFKDQSKNKNPVSLASYHRENQYMKIFLSNLILRPSCSSCFSKKGMSGSDITLGDFWNVDKIIDSIDDDKGISLVLTNTQLGLEMFLKTSCHYQEVDFQKAIQYNCAWQESYPPNPNRNIFFSKYKKHKKDFDLYAESLPPTFFEKIRNCINYRLNLTLR